MGTQCPWLAVSTPLYSGGLVPVEQRATKKLMSLEMGWIDAEVVKGEAVAPGS